MINKKRVPTKYKAQFLVLPPWTLQKSISQPNLHLKSTSYIYFQYRCPLQVARDLPSSTGIYQYGKLTLTDESRVAYLFCFLSAMFLQHWSSTDRKAEAHRSSPRLENDRTPNTYTTTPTHTQISLSGRDAVRLPADETESSLSTDTLAETSKVVIPDYSKRRSDTFFPHFFICVIFC